MATISTPNRYDRLEFPVEDQLQEARDILKPPGIMSKAYNKFQLKKVEREYAIAKHHPLSQEALAKKSQTDILNATGNSEEIPYFRVKTLHNFPSTYDRIKGVDSGYDPKLHRDDRHNAKSRGLRVNEED